MRSRLISILFGFFACAGFAFNPPADIIEARELCDRTDLRPIEGIWLFPEDDVTVLIIRDDEKLSQYDIFVVESADCALQNGKKLGEMKISPNSNKFKLSLFTSVKKGILSVPCSASAVLSDTHESITVTKPSLKFNFYPNRLLSGFWGLVRISVKNPDNVPEGLIKIYPSYDGNNSSKRTPRYL